MKTNTIQGTYGSGETPCQVFTLTTRRGLTWYAVEDSHNVNATWYELTDGVNVETVPDVDAFTWPDGVHSEEDLETAVES